MAAFATRPSSQRAMQNKCVTCEVIFFSLSRSLCYLALAKRQVKGRNNKERERGDSRDVLVRRAYFVLERRERVAALNQFIRGKCSFTTVYSFVLQRRFIIGREREAKYTNYLDKRRRSLSARSRISRYFQAFPLFLAQEKFPKLFRSFLTECCCCSFFFTDK